MWVLLTPREIEAVARPLAGGGKNAVLLRELQKGVNVNTGDLDLTDDQAARIHAAKRNWRGGGERQFAALVEALRRHEGDRPDQS